MQILQNVPKRLNDYLVSILGEDFIASLIRDDENYTQIHAIKANDDGYTRVKITIERIKDHDKQADEADN